jgi:hypothetical protein
LSFAIRVKHYTFAPKLLCNVLELLALDIMLREELTLKWMNRKMVFGFGYPRACRFRKTKPINQFRSTNFFQNVNFIS